MCLRHSMWLISLSRSAQWLGWLALLVTVLPCQAQTSSYHIGNSLTDDSQPLALEAFAQQQGLTHTSGFHILGGASISEVLAAPDSELVTSRAEFGNYEMALPNHAWDFVTFQPHTNKDDPATPEDETSYLFQDIAGILEFIDLARMNPANADTKFYIYSTWPSNFNYQEKWLSPTANNEDTPTTRTRAFGSHVLNRVRDATDAEVYMIPAGEVLFELDKKTKAGEIPGFNSANSFYRDLVHLKKDVGRYVASVTKFTTLFGIDPFLVTKPEDFFLDEEAFSPEFFEVVHETIRDVVARHPYSGVTLPLPTSADFNFSGIVDDEDLTEWVDSYGVQLTADTNDDMEINGRDLLAWQRGYKTSIVTDPGNSADFDTNDFVDQDDLATWSAAYGATNGGDTDADGDTDGADLLAWQRQFTAFDAADFNLDRLVNGDDLSMLIQGFGDHLRGDSDGSRSVTGTDLLAWQRDYGIVSLVQNATAAVTSVPEPSCLALLCVMGSLCSFSRNRMR